MLLYNRKVFSREAFPSLTWILTKAGSIVIDTKIIAELKEGPKVLILDILYINWCPSWTMMIMTSCGRCTSWARWCSQRLSTSRLQCLSDKYLLSFLLQLCQVLTSCFWYIFNSESFPAVLSSYVSDAICWISKRWSTVSGGRLVRWGRSQLRSPTSRWPPPPSSTKQTRARIDSLTRII